MLGEFLYQLSPRDLQTTFIDAVYIRNSNAAAAASVGAVLYTVPPGRILLVGSLGIDLTSGSAQQALGYRFFWNEEGATLNRLLKAESFSAPAVAAQSFHADWRGEITILPQGAQISFRGIFDAGVELNSVVADLTGVQLPRGNFGV